MTNPLDFEAITNMYLYGITTTPANKATDALIRPADRVTSLSFAQSDVMATAGRFAVGAQFGMVRNFFNDPTLIAGTYTKAQIIDRYHINKAFFAMQQKDYADSINDYAARTYIWNNMTFMVNEDALFNVDANGAKTITNFSVSAFSFTADGETVLPQDNFDFTSTSDNSIGNTILQGWIDPSEIGRKINLNFTGTMPTYTYTQANYQADLTKMSTWSNPFLTTTYDAMVDIADDLFDAGITDFRDEQGRPIFYGTEAGDTLSADDLPDAPYLEPYLDNGVVLITGKGDDILKGGGAESSLHGGTGKDIFSLSNMSFIMDGESNDRTVWGGYLISGGVQQWWQEGGYAYYSAAAPLVNVGIGSQILLGALTLFDAPFMTSTRFAMTNAGQLLIQKGRHHTAFVQDYDYEDATAGITVFRQALTTDGTIADLTRYMKLALKASGMISPDADPLLIDMNGDGITLSRVGSATSVYIDANNDGFAENRGWVRGGDALLVRDTNGNGRVDGWGELFGNASESGFAALRAFDSNADDRITAADAHFSRLHVWVDDNHNAISEAGELRTLSHAGITALSLATRAPAPSRTAISHLQAA
jgi:hypothetical protein